MLDPLGRTAPTRRPDSAPWTRQLAPDLEARLADEIRRLQSSGWAPPTVRRKSFVADGVFGDARDTLADLVQRQIDQEGALRAEAWRRITATPGVGSANSRPAVPLADAGEGPSRLSDARMHPVDGPGLLLAGVRPNGRSETVRPGVLGLASEGAPARFEAAAGAPRLGDDETRRRQLAAVGRDPIDGQPCIAGNFWSGEGGPLRCGPGGGGGSFGGAAGGGGSGPGLFDIIWALMRGAGHAVTNALRWSDDPQDASGERDPKRFEAIPNPMPRPPEDFEPPEAGKDRTESIPQVPPEAASPSPLPAQPKEEPPVFVFPDMSDEFGGIHIVESHRGNADTVKHIRQVPERIRSNQPTWKHIAGGVDLDSGEKKKERALPGPGAAWKEDGGPGDGRPGSRFPDLLYETPDGTLVAINTVDVDANGQIAEWELDAAAAIRRAHPRIQVYLIKKPHQLKNR